MAYGAKYITEFRDIKENLFKITLYWRDYTGETIEVTPGANPFKRTYHRDDKFAATKGMSAEIVLFAEQDRQFLDLYTADYKQCMVEVLKNGSPFFLGYLDAETYQESFSDDKYYDVSLFANNGINVLERDRYVDENGETYSGSADMLTVIERIIEKLGLPLSHIKYAADIAVNGYDVPSGEIILQHLIVNQDNYIDEDGIVMSCRDVLESILTPLGLTLFIEGEDVWIVDTEYLKNGTITVHTKTLGSSGTFTTAQMNVVKDLSELSQAAGEFTVEAGFNLYKLTKNRYIKDIIEEVDFDDEDNFEGDIYENVIRTAADNYGQDSFLAEYWVNKLDGFKNYTINEEELTYPHMAVFHDFFNVTAFAGGCKPVKYVDNVDIDFDEDDVNFNNYIFISNPYKNFGDYQYPESWANPDLPSAYNILKEAFRYSKNTPFIFPSTKTIIRLKFKAFLLSFGQVVSDDNVLWYYRDYYPSDEYYVFKHTIGIYLKDKNGNIAYSLTNNGAAKSDELIYKLTPGEHKTYYLIDEINEAGFFERVFNKNVDVNIDIPAEFGDLHQLEVVFYNEFFRFDNGEEHGDLKETLPLLGIKDIETELIDKNTGEAISLNDEELQYYLSEKFKTEKQEDELYHYTADDQYITDLGGITLDNDYIIQVSANGITKDNFEDLRGDKIIRQYQDNQIVLSLSLYEDNLPVYSLLTMQNDTLWNNKKFVIVSETYDARMRIIDVVLEEVK
ncbi:hypothetical protein ACT29H_01665 [Thermophagus sp. OGC60D27]|uniref:hypothetical protein n=1 Tax=Thermophagus sp. OGC60D27 TaxID=3458415 RepID=UPI0040380969